MSETTSIRAGEVRFMPKQKMKGGVWTTLLLVLGIAALLVSMLFPARRTASSAARRNVCISNLERIGIALRDYEADHGSLPPAYTVDAEGKPLHSWRTLILPYLEQQELYDTIDLSKSWDDPANEEARNTHVPGLLCPEAPCDYLYTTYFAVVTPDSCFPLARARKLSEICDSHSQTVMVIEGHSDRAVHWMCPQDADEHTYLQMKTDSYSGSPCAIFVDGHVQSISPDTSPAILRALISVAGKEKISQEDLE